MGSSTSGVDSGVLAGTGSVRSTSLGVFKVTLVMAVALMALGALGAVHFAPSGCQFYSSVAFGTFGLALFALSVVKLVRGDLPSGAISKEDNLVEGGALSGVTSERGGLPSGAISKKDYKWRLKQHMSGGVTTSLAHFDQFLPKEKESNSAGNNLPNQTKIDLDRHINMVNGIEKTVKEMQDYLAMPNRRELALRANQTMGNFCSMCLQKEYFAQFNEMVISPVAKCRHVVNVVENESGTPLFVEMILTFAIFCVDEQKDWNNLDARTVIRLDTQEVEVSWTVLEPSSDDGQKRSLRVHKTAEEWENYSFTSRDKIVKATPADA